MATTPTSISASARGVTRTLSGYIVESESISKAPQSEQTSDQTGAIAAEEIYDHRTDLSLTVISSSSTRTAPACTNDKITYGGATYFVDSVEEAGTYNGILRFNIKAHRWDNCPAS